MRLPNFSSLSKKKTPPSAEHLLAIQVGHELYKIGLWQMDSGVTSIKRVETGADPNTLVQHIIDEEKVTISKVIFGLLPEHVDGDKIRESALPKLKAITSKFALKPLGFVVVPEAIAHFMASSEETPPTAILVSVTKRKLIFSLFRIGQCKDTVEIERSGTLFEDFEQGIALFVKEEVLPSKIILYDDGSNLEDMKEELLSYPWQKNDKFLHVPKIELLPNDVSIKAIIQAGVSELNNENVDMLNQPETLKKPEPAITPEPTITPKPEVPKEPAPEHAMITVEEHHLTIPEEPAIPATPKPEPITEHKEIIKEVPVENMLGFVAEKDIAEEQVKEHKPELIINEPYEPKPSLSKRLAAIGSITSKLKLPHGKNKLAFLAVGIAAILGIFLLVYFYPSANISLIADPEIINKQVAITLDTSITSPNIENKEIPGKVYTVSVSGEKSKQTSGKKTIGEKATGEMTLLNKTTKSKTIAKGMVLTGPSNVKFTLDSEATIASASDTGTSLEYGKKTVAVTAFKIGPTSNIKSGAEFQIGTEPTSSFVAKNDKDLTGGTEREIDAVDKIDQSDLLKSLTDELLQEAKQKLQNQITSGDKFLDSSLKENVVEKVFDKDVGEEADNIALKLTLEITQTGYRDEDLRQFFADYVKGQVPEGFEFQPDKSSMQVTNSDVQKDGTVVFTANYHAFLLPKIDTGEFRKKIAGKPIKNLEDAAKELSDKHIIGYEIKRRTLPIFQSRLPFLESNIQVKVIPY